MSAAMTGKGTPRLAAPANTHPTSSDLAAGASSCPESIPKLHLDRQKLLDHITVLDKTTDTFSDLMQSAVSKLLELDEYTQEVEAERDSLKESLEEQKKVEDELKLKIEELEVLNKKQKADLALISEKQAAALQASWEEGRAQGRKEMKEAINVHLSNLCS